MPARRLTDRVCCARTRQLSSAPAAPTVRPRAPPPPPPPPPRPSYFSRETLYPFLVLSVITSLAINLSHTRSERDKEFRHLRAQISVLERVLARLRAIEGRVLDEDTLERIEKELELVGLGRGKGRETIEEELNRKANEPIAWKEVLLGKKGKGFEQETDNTDWEKVFREADEAEQRRQAGRPGTIASVPTPTAASTRLSPTPAAATPRPPPVSASPFQTPSSKPAHASSSSDSYL